jgi:hypothetical protein
MCCHPHPQSRPRCNQRPPRRTAAKTRDSVAMSTPGATRMLASASMISIKLGTGTLGDCMSCTDRMSACKPAVPPTSVLTVTVTAGGSTARRTRHRCSAGFACRRQVDNKFACRPCRAAPRPSTAFTGRSSSIDVDHGGPSKPSSGLVQPSQAAGTHRQHPSSRS